MKNIFNKFAFFIALSFVFISCGNLTTSENDDSIPQGKGKITISTDLQNGRSVLPTAIEETTTGLKWELVGKKNGEQKTIKTWTDDNSRTAYELMTDSEIVIDTGTWDFTLTASQNNATAAFNVLQAHCNSVQINAGNNTLNFVMQEATENAATGSIEFTLKFPKDVVDKVEAKLFKYENKDTEISTQTLNIDSSSTDNCSFVKYSYPDATGTTSSDLSAGYYILKIELQQNVGVTTEDFKKINTYSCLIRVAPGLLSQGKYTLTDLAQLYTINYECNQGSIGNQLTTTSYNAYTSFALPEPTYQGHYFAGWYTRESADDGTFKETLFGNAGETTTINKDITLYAKYVKAYEFNLYDSANNEVSDGYKVENGIGSVSLDNTGNSVWDYYLKSTGIFNYNYNYKITVEMKAEADSVVAIQAANADMFFTVSKDWTTCTMETGFIEKKLDSTRNAITFGIGLSQKTYFRNLVIEEISSDDGLPTLVFDITTEGINQYLNTQNKAAKIIEVEKTTDTDNKLAYNITINAPLSHQDGDIAVQDVKLHLRDYAKSVGVNNVSFKVSNTGENPFATSFLADTASNNSMAWNSVRTEVTNNGFNTCKIDFPNYTANDELTVDVITGSGKAYLNHPVTFTISDFKVENASATAGPFSGKIFAIKTGDTWTQGKSVEVTIPADGSIEFDVGMFNGWDSSQNKPSSFDDVTRFFYIGDNTGDTKITDDLIYSVNNDNPNEPKFNITNDSSEDKIVKISLNEKYEVVIEDVSCIVTTWADLKYRIGNTSISEIVIKNDLTATERIYIGGRIVKIIADRNVIISRAAEGEFFLIYDGAGLELGCEEYSITLDGKNETVENKGPLIWQYQQGLGVTLTNCILQNNTLSNDDEQYERGAAIKTEQLFTMNNCSISNCHGSNGGAVYTFRNGSFTMNGGTISGCTAKENGNAVYIDSGNLTLSGDAEITSDVYIANENSVIVAGELTKEKVATITLPAYNVGTPVITAADSSINLADQVGKFTLKNENYKISDEGTVVSKSGGGGTVNPDVTVTSWSTLKSTIESIDTTYTEENPYVIEITSDITTSADTAAEITVSSHVKLVSNTNCIITRTSDFAGVNLFQVNTEASLTIGDANAGGTLTLDGGGTDVSATKSLVNVTGTLVLNEKSVLQNNNCPDSYATSGAAVFSNGGTLKVFGSTIKNNSNNHSSNFGGAIYIKNGTLNITSGTFEENKTNKNGGAIYVTEGTVNITGGNFINNKVSTGSNKTETSYGGGAIYIDSAETSISAATFESNITEDGVGTLLITNIGTETSPAMIYNCTFTNNTAYQNGAAIYTGGNSYIEINNCTFTDNTLSIDGSHDVYIGNTGGTTKINGSAMTGAWTSSSN